MCIHGADVCVVLFTLWENSIVLLDYMATF